MIEAEMLTEIEISLLQELSPSPLELPEMGEVRVGDSPDFGLTLSDTEATVGLTSLKID